MRVANVSEDRRLTGRFARRPPRAPRRGVTPALRPWWSLLAACCLRLTPSAAAADFQKDDQVLFVRDEPLLLYGKPAATAHKGEAYTVLAYQPAQSRVYLLAKDAAGKPVSLNASDFAVVALPGRGWAAYVRALNDLRLGRWPEAVRELSDALAAEPQTPVYSQVRDALVGVLNAQRGLTLALEAQEKASVLSRQKRRNAEVGAAVNPLTPSDHSGSYRAAQDRKAARDIDAKAQAAVDAARTALANAGLAYDGALLDLARAHAADAVTALFAARARLLPERSTQALGTLAYANLDYFDALAARAAADAVTARRELDANRPDAADHAATAGLEALPTDRDLKATQMRAEMRLAAAHDHLPEIDAAIQAGNDAAAQRQVAALLGESADDPELLKRQATLSARARKPDA